MNKKKMDKKGFRVDKKGLRVVGLDWFSGEKAETTYVHPGGSWEGKKIVDIFLELVKLKDKEKAYERLVEVQVEAEQYKALLNLGYNELPEGWVEDWEGLKSGYSAASFILVYYSLRVRVKPVNIAGVDRYIWPLNLTT